MDTPILDNLIFYLTAAITLIGLPVLVGGQLWTLLTPWAGVLAGAATFYLSGFCWARLLDHAEERSAEDADIIDLGRFAVEERKNAA